MMYLDLHRGDIAARDREYRNAHIEECKIRHKRYAEEHHDAVLEKQRKRYALHRADCINAVRAYRKKHPEAARIYNMRHSTKHDRNLGFIPINQWFNGSEGHHLDREHIIFIPKEIHRSVFHNIWTGYNMDRINDAAIAWYIAQ